MYLYVFSILNDFLNLVRGAAAPAAVTQHLQLALLRRQRAATLSSGCALLARAARALYCDLACALVRSFVMLHWAGASAAPGSQARNGRL